jgi:hypothetical protein
MNFNINFIGQIPYNPDNLHKPKNELNQNPVFASDRPFGIPFREMFRLYWTVKSFEVNLSALVIDTRDPLSDFLIGGSRIESINLASLGQLTSSGGSINIKQYTKIYSKYSKRVRKAREGIINNQTQSDVGGDQALDLDEEIDPNKLEAFTYKTNEGNLCSAGPVHFITNSNLNIIIDFSDIVFLQNLYWPRFTILGNVPGAKVSFGNAIRGQVIFNGGVGLGSITTGGIDFTGALRNKLQINATISNTQTLLVQGSIKPGKRCCDRFLWDGKDKERLELSDDPNNDGNSCDKVCGDDEEKGVYAKTINRNSNI